jgi:hypothetical protein
MEPYEPTLSEVMTKLRLEGYTRDLSMKPQFLECGDGAILLFPAEFHVDKVFRFEGLTNPDDESILYAISSTKYNLKGVLVEAYGVYTDSVSNEMMLKLRAHD